MKNISQISLKGKKVLIRVDFNVPLDEYFNITDDSRIIASLPTIKKVISNGGRAILMSHLGRPKNGFEEKFSLQHVIKPLSKLLNSKIIFCKDCIGITTTEKVNTMLDGDVLVLENLRFYSEEKEGNENFAKKLSHLGDIYVNDAFGTAHRTHASTAIITKFFYEKKYLGLLLYNEIKTLKKVLTNPKRPFTAIIGGAKISGKIDVLQSLFSKVDNLIIGGGMAYTFVKSIGGNVGKSLVEDNKLDLARKLIEEADKKGVNLILPVDSVNANGFKNDAKINFSNILSIKDEYMGLDIGAQSIIKFSNIIMASKTLIWNGPMGVFEMKNFENGTKQIGEIICRATENGAFSLIGGGDSIASVKKFNFSKRVSYISTGGGAMLEYLEGKQLPAVAAITD